MISYNKFKVKWNMSRIHLFQTRGYVNLRENDSLVSIFTRSIIDNDVMYVKLNEKDEK